MNPRDMLLASATRLARAIRDGETTSLEVVRAHAAHIERHDPSLNAIVESRLTAALREAEAADQKQRRGEALGPLHGVPCTIKESFAVDGMPLTAGLVSRIGTRSQHDAVAVQRLRAAGAIVVGVTNISELLMWMESDNRVYGRCNNPYDLGRTVGGSSGGEGAAVGAGLVPFGLGADIGGSIRLPAFMNGVFGHKPTGGLIPNAGQWPLPGPDAMRFVTSGPLVRRAEDLWPLVKVLAGPTAASPEVLPIALGDPSTVSIEGMRVLHVAGNGVSRVHPSLALAQERAADALGRRGARVERAKIRGLSKSVLYWATLLSETGGEDFGRMLAGGEGRVRVGRELVKLALGRSAHTLPALALAAIEGIPKMLPGDSKKLVAEAHAFRRELEERIGDGVMLYPTYTLPAPHHGVALRRPIDWAYTALLNVMELPSTAVPLGLEQGVPLGCQVVANNGQDHRSVAVALELERSFGGWVPPPRIFA